MLDKNCWTLLNKRALLKYIHLSLRISVYILCLLIVELIRTSVYLDLLGINLSPRGKI